MHLGTFPNGIEFAAFVMARNNYPFENMSMEDHQRMFADARNTVPTAAQMYQSPSLTSGDSLDYAELNPSDIVRTGAP